MPGSEQEFIFIRLTVLREYLEKELTMTNLPFKQDMEVSQSTLGRTLKCDGRSILKQTVVKLFLLINIALY